jgi:hypothetical protein
MGQGAAVPVAAYDAHIIAQAARYDKAAAAQLNTLCQEQADLDTPVLEKSEM